MNKDFLPYNESLELKELGFDEPCFAYYLAGGIRFKEYKDSKNKNSAFYNNTVCSIPMFSQAFRWFREKHDLHSCVAPVYEDEISKVIVYWFWIQGFDSFEDEDINYKTPEEAELACLQKLIQIVKK